MESPQPEQPFKHVKSQDELKYELKDQIELLKSSVSSYEKGLTAEAKRMATIMRILFSDSSKANSRSKSLSLQLGIKEHLRFHSVLSANEQPDEAINLLPGGLSFQAKLTWRGGSAGFFPLLGQPKEKVDFDTWWNQFLYRSKGIGLTRRELILSIADRDGGAHVDGEVTGEYANLSRVTNTNTGFTSSDESGTHNLINDIKLERVLMRQIAHEVLETFNEQLETLIGPFDLVDPTANFIFKKTLSHVEQYNLMIYMESFYGDYKSARTLINNDQLKEACFFINYCIAKEIKSILLWWGFTTDSNDVLYLYNQLMAVEPDLCKSINYLYIKEISHIIRYPNLVIDSDMNDFGFVITANKFLAELDYIHSIIINKLNSFVKANLSNDNPDGTWQGMKLFIDDNKASSHPYYGYNNYLVANMSKAEFLNRPDLVFEYRILRGEFMTKTYAITHNPDQEFSHIAFPNVGIVNRDHPEFHAKAYEDYLM
jgi:hypothetical protein